MRMLRASLHTIGCRLNQAETAVLADQLRSQGYELVEFGQPSDLFVLNTCSVTASAEADCRNLVRRMRRASPDAFIAVTGCYAQTGLEALRKMGEVGVNVARYCSDGLTLLDVVESLERIPGVNRIRISSIEPTTISDALLERMAGPSKLCPYLHVPLQSGDDDVLRAMNRRYTAREYADFVEKAMCVVPDLGLGTDVMVGFPGESEAAFANTRALLE